MERAPDYIVRDLGTKLAHDIQAAVARTTMLLGNPDDRASIAFLASGAVLGLALAHFEAGEGTSGLAPDQVADALWQTTLRPIVVGVAAQLAPEQIVAGMVRRQS